MVERRQRCVAADSSSIILLQKSILFETLLACYDVAVAEEVYTELTCLPKKGAARLKQLLNNRIIASKNSPNIDNMGRGEKATIGLFNGGVCDFVLLDDRRAAHYCRDHQVPFVNSLLVPRILQNCGLISEKEAQVSSTSLLQNGYYSAAVISRAKALTDADLRKFYPTETTI